MTSPLILLRVVEDAYAYFDRPISTADLLFWISFMKSMIEKEGIGDVRDRILLLDYKASQAKDDDDNEEAFKFEKEAASLITEVTADNALLYSNIHANLGTLYFMRDELDNARPHIEEGIRILQEFDLLYMHDAIPQTCLFAQLQAAYGNVEAALSILKKAGKVVAREISIYSTDYANIEETIGSILASAGKTRDAIDHFRKVLKAYAEIYEYDPYLETREKEERFVQKIVEAVEHTLGNVLPLFLSGYAAALCTAAPDGTMVIPKSTAGIAAEDSADNSGTDEADIEVNPEDIPWDYLDG